MHPKSASPCITTQLIAETREFYQTIFNARITFDCGWYVNLALADGVTLQFMQPQGDQPTCATAGLTYNFCVADVDEEYRRLAALNVDPVMPIEDHPWGDRGFAISDPNGIMLYIYSDREPAPEFKQYCS
ncbi:VOC family protein [Rhodopseudomonas pseudopalustris]|uniref:Uncharacterized conserved protein PhnB, glyoxalase superfamily n=1 Tax=Rhodopseudomonas pseudopalustris TaxID=1513892 RepID=A0A1H8VBC5_9BRAD|nr:VOC family protein [Rhodopseudomonas pseudopalustris]SEP12760.1 Uncharacterized conserved protein PhnB, glyoxalase superfamily [Rhodopseudomonas pseudopalustris]